MLIEGHIQHALLAVASALFASVAMIYLRALGPRESSAAVATFFSLFAFLCFLGLALYLHAPWTPRAVPWMLGAGLCAGIAQLLMTRAYRHDTAARVSTYGYLAVPFSAISEIALRGSYPSLSTLLGAVLVSAGGAWLATERSTTDSLPAQ